MGFIEYLTSVPPGTLVSSAIVPLAVMAGSGWRWLSDSKRKKTEDAYGKDTLNDDRADKAYQAVIDHQTAEITRLSSDLANARDEISGLRDKIENMLRAADACPEKLPELVAEIKAVK